MLAADFEKSNEISEKDDNTVKGNVYLFKNPEESQSSLYVNAIEGFLQFFLLLSSILPISLLVSIEIIKVLQAILMGADVGMYALEIDQRCKVISISLNEELGLINNIFTDKTGTL